LPSFEGENWSHKPPQAFPSYICQNVQMN